MRVWFGCGMGVVVVGSWCGACLVRALVCGVVDDGGDGFRAVLSFCVVSRVDVRVVVCVWCV